MTPRRVFIFANGQVAVTDAAGEQIVALQGDYAEMYREILAAADEDTVFYDARATNGYDARAVAAALDSIEGSS